MYNAHDDDVWTVLWRQNMTSDYDVRLWRQTMASDYDVRLWRQTMTSDYDYDVHVRTILWVEDIGCKEDREGEEDDLCYVVQRHIIQPLDKNTVLC